MEEQENDLNWPASYDLSPSIKLIHSTAGVIATGNSNVTLRDIFIQIFTKGKWPKKYDGIKFQLSEPISTFRGRENELKSLKTLLDVPSDNKFKMVLISGSMGIGKSDLARKFLKDQRNKYENIIWIKADRNSSMEDNFEALQEILNRRGSRCKHLQDVYRFFDSKNCIFVFDGAKNENTITPFLPKENNKSLFLITSRNKWNPHILTKSTNILDEKNAENVSKAILDINKIQISKNQFRKLLENRSIPLVLQLTIGLVCQEIIDCKNTKRIENIINDIDKNFELEVAKLFDCSFNPNKLLIFGTISRSLNYIWAKNDEISKLASDILEISAYLDNNYISDDILISLLSCTKDNLDKSIVLLKKLSLIQIISNQKIQQIFLHRPVQDFLQFHFRKIGDCKPFLCSLFSLLNDGYIYKMHNKIIFQHGEKYLDLIRNFCNENKCYLLYKNICSSATIIIIKDLIEKCDLIYNPQFLSIALNYSNVMKVLQEFKVNFNVRNDEDFSVIYYACTDEYTDQNIYIKIIWKKIQALIENSANINSRNSVGNTVLQNLCEFGQKHPNFENLVFACCTFLISCGADIKIKNNNQETASDIAKKYKLCLTEQLLNLVMNDDIFLAVVKCKDFELLKCLVELQICNVDQQDYQGSTFLHKICALELNNLKTEHQILNFILWVVKNSYAHISIKNNVGETAEDVCEKYGRNILSNFLNFWTSLENFIDKYSEKINKFPYIRKKKHINFQDDLGNTLLHVICDLDEDCPEEDLIKFTIYLLVFGEADAGMKNREGYTPKKVAKRKNRLVLSDYLKIDSKKILQNLLETAAKLGNYEMLKYIWWTQYVDSCIYNKFSDNYVLSYLNFLSKLQQYVSDENIISLMKDLGLECITKNDEKNYDKAVDAAHKAGREILVKWLEEQKENSS